MSVITSGLYKVTLAQSIGANTAANIFWYRNSTGDNDKPQELYNSFEATVLNTIAPIQHTLIQYTDLKVEAVFGNALEVAGVPSVSGGSLVGTLLPAFNSISIRLHRADKSVRSGWKRFAGITEEVVSSPGFIAAYIADAQTAADAMSVNVGSGGEIYIPVVVRKPFSTKAQLSDWFTVDIASASALNRVTTQNTRKTF